MRSPPVERLGNESFISAPQLRRTPLDGAESPHVRSTSPRAEAYGGRCRSVRPAVAPPLRGGVGAAQSGTRAIDPRRAPCGEHCCPRLVCQADSRRACLRFPLLAGLGYEFRPEEEIPDRHYFRRPPGGELRTHHLSLAEPGSRHHRVTLAFRDALRGNSELAAAYARLKLALAEKFPCDRPAYIEGKSAFVRQVLATIELQESGGAA